MQTNLGGNATVVGRNKGDLKVPPSSGSSARSFSLPIAHSHEKYSEATSKKARFPFELTSLQSRAKAMN